MTQLSLYLLCLLELIWNYTLHNIAVTPKMGKKVITDPNSSKASSGGSEEMWIWIFMHISWPFLVCVGRSLILIDILGWFWMESLSKSIQVILVFLKAPFLVVLLSLHTLMTFQMMLSVILLSMLMMLLSALKLNMLLICGVTARVGFWNLSDLRDTMNLVGRLLVSFNSWETQFVSFGCLSLMINHLLRTLGLPFSIKLDWGSHIIYITETVSTKNGALICSMKFLFQVFIYIWVASITCIVKQRLDHCIA